MAGSKYEYSTSPKKLEPDIQKKSKKAKNNIKVVKDLPRQEVKVSKEQRKRQKTVTLFVIAIFALLLTISYRNSQINEKFSEMQSLKKDLATLERENQQLKVSIENSLNSNNIEKQAKEKLGMQKLTNRQTMYVTLPKKDYVESASEEIVKIEKENWLDKIVDKIFNK